MANTYKNNDGVLVLVITRDGCFEYPGERSTVTVQPDYQEVTNEAQLLSATPLPDYLDNGVEVEIRLINRTGIKPPWLNCLRRLMAVDVLKGCEASARSLADLLVDEVARQSMKNPPVTYDKLLAVVNELLVQNTNLRQRVEQLEAELNAQGVAYGLPEDWVDE